MPSSVEPGLSLPGGGRHIPLCLQLCSREGASVRFQGCWAVVPRKALHSLLAHKPIHGTCICNPVDKKLCVLGSSSSKAQRSILLQVQILTKPSETKGNCQRQFVVYTLFKTFKTSQE